MLRGCIFGLCSVRCEWYLDSIKKKKHYSASVLYQWFGLKTEGLIESRARVTSTELRVWVRLHTCCTLRNQCPKVKPAISKHTQGDLLHGNKMHQCFVSLSANLTTNRLPISSPSVHVWRSIVKVMRWWPYLLIISWRFTLYICLFYWTSN